MESTAKRKSKKRKTSPIDDLFFGGGIKSLRKYETKKKKRGGKR